MPLARKPDNFKNTVKAMMDISDGLLIDLHRLCEESEVGAEIYIDKIPMHPEVVKVAKLFHIDPIKIILSGGEDYELLVVSDKVELKETDLIPIGKIIRDKGIYIVDPIKGKTSATPEGWQHF
jgi:thiamine-monophosphate kinase